MFFVKISLFFIVSCIVNASGEQKKEVNIVVIGKTGTGKSSLINIFYNHIMGVDASGPVKVIIPLCHNEKIYPVTVPEYQNYGVQVQCGGKSETKKVNKYTSENKSHRVVLWDTPGFMDTEGGLKDDEHMKTIALALKDVQIHAVVFASKPSDFDRKKGNDFSTNINIIQRMLPKTFRDNLVAVFNTRGESAKSARRESLRDNFDILFDLKSHNVKSKAYFIDGSSFFDALTGENDDDSLVRWKADDLVVSKLIEDAIQKAPVDGKESYHVSELGGEIQAEVRVLTKTLLNIDDKKSFLIKKRYELKGKEELRDSNADYSKTRQVIVNEHVEDPVLCIPFHCFTKGRDVQRVHTDNYIDEAQRGRYQNALIQIGTISGQISFCENEISDLEKEQRKIACKIVKSQEKLEKLAMTTDYSPYLQYLQKMKLEIQKNRELKDSDREHQLKQYSDWIAAYKRLSEERICAESADL